MKVFSLYDKEAEVAQQICVDDRLMSSEFDMK